MDEQQIRNAIGHELDALVAEALGHDYLRQYHDDIARAWELGSNEYRYWTSEHYPIDSAFQVTISTYPRIITVVSYEDFDTKNEARATALCRVWLLAKLQEG